MEGCGRCSGGVLTATIVVINTGVVLVLDATAIVDTRGGDGWEHQ